MLKSKNFEKNTIIDQLERKAKFYGFQKEKYKKGLLYINKAIVLNPNNLYALKVKASLMSLLEKYKESNKILFKIISIDKYYADAYDGLANNFFLTRQYDKALSLMKKAIKFVDRFEESKSIKDTYYISLSDIHKARGDYEKAMRVLKQGLRKCKKKKYLRLEIKNLSYWIKKIEINKQAFYFLENNYKMSELERQDIVFYYIYNLRKQMNLSLKNISIFLKKPTKIKLIEMKSVLSKISKFKLEMFSLLEKNEKK
jgi:tetratricopeptide (TPR) repeat protein